MESQERRELLGLVVAMPTARASLAKAKIDISYEWTNEDLQDFARASADYANRTFIDASISDPGVTSS